LFPFCRVTENIRVAVKEPHRELRMSWSTALLWKLAILIPLETGGAVLARLAKGIGEIDGEFLK
jgi:hypothetical protein